MPTFEQHVSLKEKDMVAVAKAALAIVRAQTTAVGNADVTMESSDPDVSPEELKDLAAASLGVAVMHGAFRAMLAAARQELPSEAATDGVLIMTLCSMLTDIMNMIDEADRTPEDKSEMRMKTIVAVISALKGKLVAAGEVNEEAMEEIAEKLRPTHH